jgi:hypothetical protein
MPSLPANRTNQPFYIRALPGRARRREDLLDPHRLYLLHKTPARRSGLDLATSIAVNCPKEMLLAAVARSIPPWDGLSPQNERYAGAHAPAPEKLRGFETGSLAP